MLTGQPVRQLAYYVKDVRTAARRHVALHGSGPFFVVEFPPLTVMHRGKPTPFDITCAFGQWGTMQVELLQQNDDGPSVLHDLYPAASGRTGLHHVAMFVNNLEQAVTDFARAGHREAVRVSAPAMGMEAAFIDTVAAYGHYVELYEPNPALTGLYELVAKAAAGFTGDDPVRTFSL